MIVLLISVLYNCILMKSTELCHYFHLYKKSVHTIRTNTDFFQKFYGVF